MNESQKTTTRQLIWNICIQLEIDFNDGDEPGLHCNGQSCI